jgi:UDPglucose--hexose-1-phosphate uridylyltransferase
MPEYRTDPITGRTVIIAEGRAARPQEFAVRSLPRDATSCPFCPGHEAETPGEVFAIRSDQSRPDAPGWRIRAVPNKYPALDLGVPRPESAMGVLLSSTPFADAERATPAYGRHEVLVESPRHITLTSDLSDDELADVFRATINRILAMYADPKIEHVLPFKNIGPAAGASLAHLHSQLIGQSLVPPEIQLELDGAASYRAKHGRCVWCDLIKQERQLAAPASPFAPRKGGHRIVLESPQYIAFCPFASRFAYETWILPRQHACRFEEIDEPALSELARVARSIIARLETLQDEPAYNYVFHSAPRSALDGSRYHWQLQILPRATGIAGFELGAGIHINPTSPESAAARLR